MYSFVISVLSVWFTNTDKILLFHYLVSETSLSTYPYTNPLKSNEEPWNSKTRTPGLPGASRGKLRRPSCRPPHLGFQEPENFPSARSLRTAETQLQNCRIWTAFTVSIWYLAGDDPLYYSGVFCLQNQKPILAVNPANGLYPAFRAIFGTPPHILFCHEC